MRGDGKIYQLPVEEAVRIQRRGGFHPLTLDSVPWYRVYLPSMSLETTEPLTIGQLAIRAGVNVQTVRYYERRGLVTPVARRESGYRQFSPQDVRLLRFIKRAQSLGFSLDEIAELLGLRADGSDGCDDVRLRTEEKMEEIAGRIRDLRRMQRTLKALVVTCVERGASDRCPYWPPLTRMTHDARHRADLR